MGLSKGKQDKGSAVSATRGLVRFLLAQKEYAVDMESVREVVYGNRVLPLPGAPDYFEGLIDLRGTVIPVIHLGRRLHAGSSDSAAGASLQAHILIMEIHHKKVGFIVDRVVDVLVIERDAVQPAQNLLELPLVAIEGVFRRDERLILLLSLEPLFTPELLRQVTDVLEEQGVGAVNRGGA